MDKDTQLKPSTIKNWNADPGATMLPRATYCKRLRRQRETAEAHTRAAMGFPAPDAADLPAMMRAACPEMMSVFQRIATGPALPAAEPEDLMSAGAGTASVDGGSVGAQPMGQMDEEEEAYNEAYVGRRVADRSGSLGPLRGS